MQADLRQRCKAVGLVHVQLVVRSPLLAQEPVAIPLEQRLPEGVLLLQSASKGVVAVAGFGLDGLWAVRCLGDGGLLELMLHVPFKLDDGVLADLLFDQVAMRVVGKALVFKDFEPVVLDQALAACRVGRVRAVFAIACHRQHVVRRVKGKALAQAGLRGRENAPDAVVAIARGAVSQVIDAL